jgi:putative oxidoreductase
MSDGLSLLSRILLSAAFIFYGYFALANVSTWLTVNQATLKRFFDMVASGTPAPVWFGYLIGAIMLLGGVAILIGLKTRWVAYGFVVFIILTLFFAHNFWDMQGAARGANTAHFYKNLAMIGGFLLLALHGPGSYSVDERISRS